MEQDGARHHTPLKHTTAQTAHHTAQRRALVGALLSIPGTRTAYLAEKVVVFGMRVGDTPVRQREAAVQLDRLLEVADRLHVHWTPAAMVSVIGDWWLAIGPCDLPKPAIQAMPASKCACAAAERVRTRRECRPMSSATFAPAASSEYTEARPRSSSSI
jgi:hypothetical protein